MYVNGILSIEKNSFKRWRKIIKKGNCNESRKKPLKIAMKSMRK